MLDQMRGYQASNQTKMSLYDGVDIDGVPMQSNSTEGTDLTKLCKEVYCYINIISYLFLIGRVKSPLKAFCCGRIEVNVTRSIHET